ncbi:MAG TPA: ABC transporter substrate-binding protein [Nonomuraea sp.]|nr:ABC transporter substrate-binding protein [Nonomuraea sp.]
MITLLFALAGCGYSTASTSADPALTTVKVGIMPIPDCATIPLAEARGYFKAEGLKVERVDVQGGGTALPMLENRSIQFSIMNYPAMVLYEAHKPNQVKIAADAYQAAPNTFKLMVPKDSPIRSVTDLRGKRVGVATLKSISTLTTEAALKVAGLTARDVAFAETPLPAMIVALENGHLGAAWMTEPFITAYQSQHGGRALYDVMQGQTEDLPIAGWATSTAYARSNPAQVAAFQRAVMRAQLDVARDEQLVRSILPTYTKIDGRTAGVITLGVFPTDLHPNRIQKITDLMQEYGYINSSIDVRRFLLPPPALTHTPAPPPPIPPSSPSLSPASTDSEQTS